MNYTQLGTTGLSVSRLCLGCMSYGDPQWRPWVLDEEAAGPFFRKVVEGGINFFDTADMYSLGRSEEITGRALREFARPDEVVIATKVYHPMGEGPNLRGLGRKHIQQACGCLRGATTSSRFRGPSTASTWKKTPRPHSPLSGERRGKGRCPGSGVFPLPHLSLPH